MSFCGHCGFQLAPDDTRCLRCGAIVEPETPTAHTSTNEYAPPDSATVKAASYRTGKPSQANSQVTNVPLTSSGQQKLILGAYDVEGAGEATSMMNAPVYQGTPPPGSYPNYPPQYAPPQAGYQGYANSGVAYRPYAEQYAPAAVKKRRSVRTVGLVFILVGILLILGALVVFALQHSGVIGAAGTAQASDATSSAVATTPTTPTGQAEATMQQYYASISSRDYTTAYHLWKNNTQNFADFQNGYRYTKSTTITFGSAQTRANNTIYLPVTVNATEIIASTQKTRQSTYTGYYLLEKQADSTWLILDGDLKAA